MAPVVGRLDRPEEGILHAVAGVVLCVVESGNTGWRKSHSQRGARRHCVAVWLFI